MHTPLPPPGPAPTPLATYGEMEADGSRGGMSESSPRGGAAPFGEDPGATAMTGAMSLATGASGQVGKDSLNMTSSTGPNREATQAIALLAADCIDEGTAPLSDGLTHIVSHSTLQGSPRSPTGGQQILQGVLREPSARGAAHQSGGKGLFGKERGQTSLNASAAKAMQNTVTFGAMAMTVQNPERPETDVKARVSSALAHVAQEDGGEAALWDEFRRYVADPATGYGAHSVEGRGEAEVAAAAAADAAWEVLRAQQLSDDALARVVEEFALARKGRAPPGVPALHAARAAKELGGVLYGDSMAARARRQHSGPRVTPQMMGVAPLRTPHDLPGYLAGTAKGSLLMSARQSDGNRFNTETDGYQDGMSWGMSWGQSGAPRGGAGPDTTVKRVRGMNRYLSTVLGQTMTSAPTGGFKTMSKQGVDESEHSVPTGFQTLSKQGDTEPAGQPGDDATEWSDRDQDSPKTLARALSRCGRRLRAPRDGDTSGCCDAVAEHAAQLQAGFEAATGDASVGADEEQLLAAAKAEGMDPVFARWVFGALSADDGGGVRRVAAKAYVDGMLALLYGGPADRMLFSFHIFDQDHDNIVSLDDFKGIIKVACDENGLRKGAADIEALARAIFKEAGTDPAEGLTLEAFLKLLKKHPEIADTVKLKPAVTKKRVETEQVEESCLDELMDHRRRYTWVVVFVLGHIACFVYMFLTYSVGAAEKERYLMDWSLPIAKGCAGALKLSFTLLLFPVCRHTMTALRSTPLRVIIPLDDSIAFHRALACVGGLCALIHALCHINDIKRWCDRSNGVLWLAAVGGNHTLDEQPSCLDLLATPVAITGILMITIFLIGFPFAVPWWREAKCFKDNFPKCAGVVNNFNSFWITHQLLIMFYLLLLIHPWPGKPSKSAMDQRADTWAWICVPVGIYFAERVYRNWVVSGSMVGNGLRLLDGSQVMPGKVSRLRVQRPEGWMHTAGQWAFVQVPAISQYEWHPFTISSAPGDAVDRDDSPGYVEFHIRSAGDWTGALLEKFKELEAAKKAEQTASPVTSPTLEPGAGSGHGRLLIEWPKVRIDGPFGAPAQDFARYPVVLLVGAGIGATPFCSILKDFVYRIRAARCRHCGATATANFPVKRAHFFFITRDPAELSWVKESVEEVAASDRDGDILVSKDGSGGVIDINLHVTAMKGTGTLGGAVLGWGDEAAIADGGQSPISGVGGVTVRQGRPKWAQFLRQVRRDWEHDASVTAVGASFCGPMPAAKSLRDACEDATDSRMRFPFKKESFG